MRFYQHSALALTFVIQTLIPVCAYATDCNTNGIDDADELTSCPPIEVLFLIDTSLSMQNKLPTLCARIQTSINELTTAGMIVHEEILAIAAGGEDCPCCSTTDTVVNVYGSSLLCLPEEIGDCPEGEFDSPLEDWGPATAVVAGNKEWGPGPRIIIPISDEGPRCGGDPSDPSGNPIIDEADYAAIDHAIPIVFDNRVIVSSIVSGDEITTLAQELAAGAYRAERCST